MKNVIKIALLLLVSFAAVMCKKKVQPTLSEINKDCGCAKELSADFLMEEIGSLSVTFPKLTLCDSIFGDKNVTFTAIEDGASYTWILGLDTVHTKTVTRFFYNWMVGNSYPITLIVRKKPNKICYPYDDGIDTITKMIHVARTGNFDSLFTQANYHFEGNFRIKSENDLDSIDIQTNLAHHQSGIIYDDVFIIMGLKLDTLFYAQLSGYNFTQLWFHNFGVYPDNSATESTINNFHYYANGKIKFQIRHHIFGPYLNGSDRNYYGRKL
jgi:hypothetical protein